MIPMIYRYMIDVIIMIDLFGSCCCYQIIIAKTLKQLIEDTPEAKFEGEFPGYPSLRVYLAVMIPPIILICWIRHLKYLAPFSLVANFLLGICILMVVYYAFLYNPTLQGMKSATTFYGMLEFVGVSVFSMCCAGVLGVFCITNMAFIWPNFITLLVIWERPGLGHMNWKLWRGAILIIIGLFIFFCGSLVAILELASVFYKANISGNPDEKTIIMY
ncbi:hypothetical protein HF086_001437 [Spodoptera exigua]|uniref:Amino acid transporter transmembrane domain-containing protein n=1 Tax=Spodoptera exigua TaxID=7107 RepID=A0A922MFN9_SPOEX|nr:hypothetical protein HF086_001437 [Spodoptera exigua]